jgi:hypothetical protein
MVKILCTSGTKKMLFRYDEKWFFEFEPFEPALVTFTPILSKG